MAFRFHPDSTLVVVVLGSVVELVGGGVVGDALGSVVEGATVGGVITVDEGANIVVVEVGLNTGAATLRGDAGRSLTCASAAPTICHVMKVVSTTTKTQPPAIAIRRMTRLSQPASSRPVNEPSRFHQGCGVTALGDLLSGHVTDHPD